MEDVARLTKLRTDQVLAIEEGRYQVFSAPVYVRGSVKLHQLGVGLDRSTNIDRSREDLIASFLNGQNLIRA